MNCSVCQKEIPDSVTRMCDNCLSVQNCVIDNPKEVKLIMERMGWIDPHDGGKIPERVKQAKNLKDIPNLIELRSYAVKEWTPHLDGKGKPEHLCFCLQLDGALDGTELVLRFKKRKRVEELIGILYHHMQNIWPE